MFMGPGTFAERLAQAKAAFADDPLVGRLFQFIRDGGSRPLMQVLDSERTADAGAAS
jgi:hypothetical protein